MAWDPFSAMLRGMDIDPAAIQEQAKQFILAFNALMAGQKEMLARMDVIDRQQTAIMAAMGLYVAPPTGALGEMIAEESKRHVDRYGGPVAPDPLFPQAGEIMAEEEDFRRLVSPS